MLDLESFNLMLAQDGQALPSAGGEAQPLGGTSAAPSDGSTPASGAAPSGGAGNPNSLFLLVIVAVAVMLIFSMMTQRRERKKREATLSSIKKHDRVQTIGGVIGSVVEIKPDYVVLKVDESSNTRITFSRGAIQQVLTSSSDAGSIKSE